MAAEPLTSEPEILAAGETVSWTRASVDFPASEGYTLVAYFAGPDTFQVEAEDDGGVFLFEIAPADTATMPAGVYQWRIYAEKGTEAGGDLERHEVARGSLNLEPNFTTAQPGDQALFAETMVAAIEARLSGRLEADLESYGTAGRQAQLIPFAELTKQLGIWKYKLWRAQNPGRAFPESRVVFR